MVFPWLIAASAFLLDHNPYTALFQTSVGYWWLLAVVVLETVGVYWMKAKIRPEELRAEPGSPCGAISGMSGRGMRKLLAAMFLFFFPALLLVILVPVFSYVLRGR